MYFSICVFYFELFSLLSNLACAELGGIFIFNWGKIETNGLLQVHTSLWALKALFDTFSFLVQSRIWDSKNVRFHAKRPGWTILAAVKQYVYVTDWIAWYFKTGVTIAKTWNKSFLKPATLFQKLFQRISEYWKMILFTKTPLVFLALSMYLDSLRDEGANASLSFSTARSLSWFIFFLPLKKNRK